MCLRAPVEAGSGTFIVAGYAKWAKHIAPLAQQSAPQNVSKPMLSVSSVSEKLELEDGNYEFGFYGNSSEGDEYDLVERSFTIDTINPLIKAVSPTPKNNTGVDGNFFANFSISDKNLKNFTYDWNGVETDYNFSNKFEEVPSLMDGLVGYWTFENNSDYGENATLFDYSGEGNNGTCSGSSCPNWTSEGGRYGGGYEFDGVDDYVDIDSLPSIESSMTVSAWIKSTSGDNYSSEWSGVSRYNQFILGPGRDQEMSFIVYPSSSRWNYLNPPPTPNKDTWHHFVGSWNEYTGELLLWVDGRLHANASHTPEPLSPDTGSVHIAHREGYSLDSNHLQSKID